MKVYLRTFGCRANQYDSEVIRAMIAGGGHELVREADDADLSLFNSCAVTAEAEADLRQAVRGAARRAPRARAVITGCAAGLDGAAERLGSLPGVSHVIGGADLDAIAAALDVPVAARPVAQDGTRALLRIQDGCDEHCTFCATRLARGPNRSRFARDLVSEARALAEHHPEIVLTGIHIGSYGRDTGTSLGALLHLLIDEVPRVRFRLSSLEATEVDDAILECWRSAPERLAPSLHAPLQSGSDAVLRRMGRHWYTAAGYRASIERIVDGRPAFGLGADVITGFPGETEADHRATVALVESLPFAWLHVFPWSPRPGTAAEKLKPADGRHSAARERAAELRALGEASAAAYRQSRVGGAADVVVLGGAGKRTGLTEDYLSVALADSGLPRGSRFPAVLAARRSRAVGDYRDLLATEADSRSPIADSR